MVSFVNTTVASDHVSFRGYESARKRAEKSGVRMHRSAKAGAEGRNIQKLLSKTSWYKERHQEVAGGADSDSEKIQIRSSMTDT